MKVTTQIPASLDRSATANELHKQREVTEEWYRYRGTVTADLEIYHRTKSQCFAVYSYLLTARPGSKGKGKALLIAAGDSLLGHTAGHPVLFSVSLLQGAEQGR